MSTPQPLAPRCSRCGAVTTWQAFRDGSGGWWVCAACVRVQPEPFTLVLLPDTPRQTEDYIAYLEAELAAARARLRAMREKE